MGELLYANITEQILDAAFEIHRALGPGFLEAIYEEAICHELALLKAITELADVHKVIVLSYLTATKRSVALPINFGQPSLTFKRIVRQKQAT